MNKPIEWSPRSKKDYLKLLDYLQEEWGGKIVKKFNERLQTVLETIALKPQLYPATNRMEDVRRCVVSKQTILYYRVKKDKIELITFFDTRQDPKKLKKKE